MPPIEALALNIRTRKVRAGNLWNEARNAALAPLSEVIMREVKNGTPPEVLARGILRASGRSVLKKAVRVLEEEIDAAKKKFNERSKKYGPIAGLTLLDDHKEFLRVRRNFKNLMERGYMQPIAEVAALAENPVETAEALILYLIRHNFWEASDKECVRAIRGLFLENPRVGYPGPPSL